MRYVMGLAMVVLGVAIASAARAGGEGGGSQPATQIAGSQPGTMPASSAEVERLKREVAELKRMVEALRAENEKLKKQWNDAVRNGIGGSSAAPDEGSEGASAGGGGKASGGSGGGAAVKSSEQDGPGLYRVSAGPGGKYTTTVRAKSREDAIEIGLDTVAKKAMDFDENVEIGTLKVEKIGP